MQINIPKESQFRFIGCFYEVNESIPLQESRFTIPASRAQLTSTLKAKRIEKSVAVANLPPTLGSIPSHLPLDYRGNFFFPEKSDFHLRSRSASNIRKRPKSAFWPSFPEGDVVVMHVALEESEGGHVAVQEIAVPGDIIGSGQLIQLVKEVPS